jgi:hypothetical protein
MVLWGSRCTWLVMGEGPIGVGVLVSKRRGFNARIKWRFNELGVSLILLLIKENHLDTCPLNIPSSPRYPAQTNFPLTYPFTKPLRLFLHSSIEIRFRLSIHRRILP